MKAEFESCLIEQCAPTLAGLKPGSLFRYASGGADIAGTISALNGELSGRGIKIIRLKECEKGNLIYVFRPAVLDAMLRDEKVADFLSGTGYRGCGTLDEYIEALRVRLQFGPAFPHEIGIFLGYPLQDVVGFIENGGKNFHCCGYWKVYGEQGYAQRCFARYRKCTSLYKTLFHKMGRTVLQLTVAA